MLFKRVLTEWKAEPRSGEDSCQTYNLEKIRSKACLGTQRQKIHKIEVGLSYIARAGLKTKRETKQALGRCKYHLKWKGGAIATENWAKESFRSQVVHNNNGERCPPVSAARGDFTSAMKHRLRLGCMVQRIIYLQQQTFWFQRSGFIKCVAGTSKGEEQL